MATRKSLNHFRAPRRKCGKVALGGSSVRKIGHAQRFALLRRERPLLPSDALDEGGEHLSERGLGGLVIELLGLVR
jgi:hypothetical protein